MKRLSLFLAIFMALGTLSTASLAVNPKLVKAKAQLEELKNTKENRNLYTQIVDVINEEIMKKPAINKDDKFRAAFNQAKKTCTANPSSDECIAQLDVAFDMAVVLADSAPAKKPTPVKKK